MGLGAFGEPSVAKVLEILRTETRAAMMQGGVRTVKEFTPAFVRRVIELGDSVCNQPPQANFASSISQE